MRSGEHNCACLEGSETPLTAVLAPRGGQLYSALFDETPQASEVIPGSGVEEEEVHDA